MNLDSLTQCLDLFPHTKRVEIRHKINSFLYFYEIKASEIEKAVKMKKQEKGAFQNLVFLISIEEKGVKKTINKLVRDKIPTIISQSGRTADFMVLGKKHNESRSLLKAKLDEETAELINTKNRKEAIEELADVITVLEALRLC